MFPYSLNNIYGYLRFSNMYKTSPAIEEKLKKSDCTLEELLEEEEIIQETKNQNSKLLNFFNKNIVKSLIEYIIVEPVADDHNKGHKFPFVASEILNCDVSKINEFFTVTEMEFEASQRKDSIISNVDSDIMLSSDDHFNAFSNENKEKLCDNQLGKEGETSDKQEGKTLEKQEVIPSDKQDVHHTVTEEKVTLVGNSIHPHEIMPESTLKPNKSINELINAENHQENIVNTNDTHEMKKNRIDLLDYLLSFLDTEQELNYVLVGYFSKFLALLINKFPQKILGYIYLERPETIKKLINHCDKKSIADLLPKILLIEIYTTNEKDKQLYSSTEKLPTSNCFNNLTNLFNLNIDKISMLRKSFLVQLFHNLTLEENNSEKITNIVSICSEIIENKTTLELILEDKEILNHIIGILSANTLESDTESGFKNTYNYVEVLGLVINIIKSSLIENMKTPCYKFEESDDIVNSESKEFQKKFNNTLLGETILHNLGNILKNFWPPEKLQDSEIDTKTIEGTFGSYFKTLGVKRLKIVELVYSLLTYFKNVHSILDNILVQSDFLKYLIEYFFKYEWNNLYQINFDNFFKLYLGNINNHQEITRYFFNDMKVLNLFMNQGLPYADNSDNGPDPGFSFNSNRKINHGYFAVLMEVCHRISQMQTNNPHLKEQYPNPEWDNYVTNKVNHWKKLFDRKLCVPDIPVSDEFQVSTGDTKSKETEENNSISNEEENPFSTKTEEPFFGMQNDDNWFTPKNQEQFQGVFDDMNTFEFVEDHKYERKNSKEELLLKEKDTYNLKVDEVDEGNYTDTSYWKSLNLNIIEKDHLEEEMKELEL